VSQNVRTSQRSERLERSERIERSERSERDKPLRDDVRLLGELLGETLRAHGGEELFETVERVRALSKASRTDDSRFHQLAALLAKLPVESATPLARAFAHFLNLANVAEQHHRIRRRRAYLADPNARPQTGSCQETFERLVAGGIAPSAGCASSWCSPRIPPKCRGGR